jgi:hypothetical protein
VRLAFLALAALACLACQPSTPAPPPANTQAAPLHKPALTAPTTALLVVRLSPRGEVTLGAIQPRQTRWTDPLLPFDPARHAPTATLDPSLPLPDGADRWELALVARADALPAPLVAPLLLLAPDHSPGGDLTNEWHSGGALWRAPWAGPGTTYEVIRVSPGPPLRLTLPSEKQP